MSAENAIRYVDSGDLQIAYQVLGDGPLDIVMAFEWASNLDFIRDDPRTQHFLQRFSEFGRSIHFDMRGVGLSDPVESLPPLEDWVDDIQAVMAAVGSKRAALVGHGHAAQLCMLFAAMHPDQTAALVTINGYARLRQAPDYPWGHPPSAEDATIRSIEENWGTGTQLESINPGMAQFGRDWLGRLERAAGSPRRAARMQRLVFELDVRDVLSAISAPTLVIHTAENPFARPEHAGYLVDHIAGSRYVELPGTLTHQCSLSTPTC